MRIVIAAVFAIALTACGQEPPPPAAPEAVMQQPEPSTLEAVLAAQPDDVQARYTHRHPQETLQFFGIEPGMTVVEALPGGGWYSKVACRVLGEHVLVHDLAGVQHDGLQVLRQAVEDLLVDHRLQRRARLLPARVVVVLGRLVQAEGEVVVRADPLRGIDGPDCSAVKSSPPGRFTGRAAGASQHLAAQPGMRILSPARSATELISLLNQPPICTPVLPAGAGTRPKGRRAPSTAPGRRRGRASRSSPVR
jgi:hypothetical protein